MLLKIPVHLSVFILITALTQIGGLAYVGAVFTRVNIVQGRWAKLLSRAAFFLLFYAILWSAAIYAAPVFGRVALPCVPTNPDRISVQSPLYCVLNRHYVTPQLLAVADGLAAHMNRRFPGTHTLALDAGFPFIDGFPLLPHLSHDDGRKLDLAFWYEDNNGRYLDGETRSPIGYWAFEQPSSNSPQLCNGERSGINMRWDMDWFRPFISNYQLEEARTRAALHWLKTTGVRRGVTRVFVEPHLAGRLGVKGGAIRFQGCRAARHDDHIHFQIR